MGLPGIEGLPELLEHWKAISPAGSPQLSSRVPAGENRETSTVPGLRSGSLWRTCTADTRCHIDAVPPGHTLDRC